MRSLRILLAALVAVPVLALSAPSPASAAPEPVVRPTRGEDTIVQTQLIWTSGTLIANAYGTQVYEKTFQWPLRVYGVGPVVARPTFTLRWNARAIDHKIISGGFYACPTPAQAPGEWNLLEYPPNDCFIYFTPVNQPSRTWEVNFHYFGSGIIQTIRISDLVVDYLGNAAGQWQLRN
jgi:hypothetical protein